MFENVQFFSHLYLKVEKVLLWPQNFIIKNIDMDIKNPEFYADFKFVDVDLNKYS